MAVAVKVPHRHGLGSTPSGEVGGGLKGAVPVAQEQTHGAAVKVGHGEIEMAVTVKVPYRNRLRTVPNGEVVGGLKGAVAVAQKHSHGVVAGVGHDEIEVAILVKIPHGNSRGYGARVAVAR